ncbi:MarR family winged helix-turn-helix transcriptional regulator [Streptomyces albipurpureus]|uniref:MarR family winged helix-turn-helix transcriptional regulator n=1 Tax=Streptomyces albipurpureus TaxID=2897419 RepID=A0ABT0UTQ0_9ACTN|nr:MarR family winged helix-turn-helix transcriptional regulator [Streptomyces sp. CWNU-1]MCM2391938.1 MarR family winged helix-turn-helix transcriptional regulator [Streptomyces sp. CWNU-1]
MVARKAEEMVEGLAFLLARHGASAQVLLRSALVSSGLTPRHMMTLKHLDSGPVSQQALIDMLEVDPSVLVAVLNDLEREELALRRRDPADRRRHIVEITPSGVAALRRSDEVLAEVEGELFTDLSDRERATLRGLLTRINTSPDDFSCSED